MSTGDKLRKVKDYDRLSPGLQEQIKLVYPEGYVQHLIHFANVQGEKVSALRFETFDTIYLVRMTESQARKLIREDDDYDDQGNLYDSIREQYEEEHSEVDYLSENDNYDDSW